MTCLIISADSPNNDFHIPYIKHMIASTMEELEVHTVDYNLYETYSIFYDGCESSAMDKICDEIINATFIIFVTPVILSNMSGILKNFFDALTHENYQKTLLHRKCFHICVTKDVGEIAAKNTLELTVDMLGGVNSGSLTLSEKDILRSQTEDSAKEIIEKHIEDIYRIGNKPKKIFKNTIYKINEPKPTISKYKEEEFELLPAKEEIPTIEVTEEQEKDILEISKMFASKLSEPDQQKTIELQKPEKEASFLDYKVDDHDKTPLNDLQDNFNPVYTKKEIVKQSKKTIKQHIMSLPHYLNNIKAQNMNAIYQFNVDGEETFKGFVEIGLGNCTYKDGEAESPDIIILGNCDGIRKIFESQTTAQKAFMTGQIKVRGNFVLLNQFDNIFEIN